MKNGESVNENGDENGLRVETFPIVHHSRRRSRPPQRHENGGEADLDANPLKGRQLDRMKTMQYMRRLDCKRPGFSFLKFWIPGLALLVAAGCSGIRPPPGVRPIEREMEVTGYCSCGSCTGWRRTWYGRAVFAYGAQEGQRKQIGITASGTRARVGTFAADTGLYPFGTIMYVPGYGYGRVEDRGSAIKGDAIDLYFRSHSAALEWGRRSKRVKIWLPPDPP